MNMRNSCTSVCATLTAIALLAGCLSIDIGNEGRATGQYRLAGTAEAAPPPPRAAGPIPRELLVAPVSGGNLDDSFSLVFSRSPQARSAYQFATWSDRPSAQLAQLLIERLAARRSFTSVALLGRGIGGDLQLNLVVVDFYHDAAKSPGSANVRVDVELIDKSSRRLIARRSFSSTAPVPQENAAGASLALSRAGNQVLDQLTDWIETTAAAIPAGAGRPAA